MKIFNAICCFCLLHISGAAQDLHYSQFYLNPLHLTPAQTGIFEGEMRFSAIYRSQWASVPVKYNTFGGAFDGKFLNRGNFTVNGGLLVQRDKAGDAGLSWTQIGLTGGVAHALGETQAISAGVSLGFVQRSFEAGGLTFKNQWTGEMFDPSLPTKENSLENASGLAPDLSAGLNWHLEPGDGRRTRFDVALGAWHLNRPNVNFNEDDDFRLPMRLTINAFGQFQVNDWFDVVALAASQQMGKNREILFGGGARRWLKNMPGKKTALQFTVATRLGDALIPAIQLEQNAWTFGLSYDYNISGFDVATGGRGGPELALVYRIVKAPPVKNFKACPIFMP